MRNIAKWQKICGEGRVATADPPNRVRPQGGGLACLAPCPTIPREFTPGRTQARTRLRKGTQPHDPMTPRKATVAPRQRTHGMAYTMAGMGIGPPAGNGAQ